MDTEPTAGSCRNCGQPIYLNAPQLYVHTATDSILCREDDPVEAADDETRTAELEVSA